MAHNSKKSTVMKQLLLFIAAFGLLLSSCGPMNKTKKGAIIGTAGGAAIGGVIGRASGNTALGVIIGGAVGGTAGVLIGKKMDKQAEEIKKEVPGAKVERVGEGIVVEFTSKILFGFDRSDLMSEAETNLNNLITVLNKYPDTNIEIQGHTDNKGTDEYNMSLAEKRAGAVSSFLKSHGIKSSRISLKPFGESAPKYTNETEEGRAQNRRVDFLITANEKMKADARKETTN
jgi:outer membrane protein OmpA-like peptidoglycan-associated protein